MESFTETDEPNELTCSEVFCFMAQLVEHCASIAEVISVRIPLEPPDLSQASKRDSWSNCRPKSEHHFSHSLVITCNDTVKDEAT